jgi:N-acetylmuramoyl-L-alanine amidase
MIFIALFLLAAITLTPVQGQDFGATPTPCADGQLRVGIDVGHSPRQSGAVSSRGKTEFVFNIRFARELLAKSRKSGAGPARLELFILNPEGEDMKLSARPAKAQAMGAELLVSIHHDSVQRRHLVASRLAGRVFRHAPKIHGFSLFVSRRNPRFADSFRLATLIGQSFRTAAMLPSEHHAEDIPGERRPFLDSSIGLYDVPFTVVAAAKIPAVLVELGVIVNREEERKLEDSAYRARIQLALLEALSGYCVGRD